MFTGFYLFLPGFCVVSVNITECSWVSVGFYRMERSCTGFYWVFVHFYWVFTQFQWVFPGVSVALYRRALGSVFLGWSIFLGWVSGAVSFRVSLETADEAAPTAAIFFSFLFLFFLFRWLANGNMTRWKRPQKKIKKMRDRERERDYRNEKEIKRWGQKKNDDGLKRHIKKIHKWGGQKKRNQ